MEENNNYFVLLLASNLARVVPMAVYDLWKVGRIHSSDCRCLNVTKEEAHVFIKLMGYEDMTDKWFDINEPRVKE